MTGTLSLAGRLSALDDDALRHLISVRRLQRARVDDIFDLAEAVLDAPSVNRALSRLDRESLAVLTAVCENDAADAAATHERLVAWGAPSVTTETVAEILGRLSDAILIEPVESGFTAYPSVCERLAAMQDDGLPDGHSLASTPPPASLTPVPAADARFVGKAASEAAFAAVAAVGELLGALEREPARELHKGGLALPDTRRLASALSVPVDRVPEVLRAADHAGLVARSGSQWHVTDAAEEWQRTTTVTRWERLADAWLAALPGNIRRLLRARAHAPWGDALRAFVRWLYPAAGDAITNRVTVYGAGAALLGITANDVPSAAGVELLTHGAHAAAEVIAHALPAEVDKVYVQHDLSIVAPGPLVPEVDARLRTMADVESKGLASTYRVSSESLTGAIAAGETATSIREFIAGVSLTGVPQPLDYLIDDAASRYGRVRVRTASDGSGAVVSSSDEDLLRTIEVDQALRPIGLSRGEHDELVSRVSRDAVYWSLIDARYPAVAVDEAGEPERLRRRHVPASQPPPRDEAAELVARLRAAGGDDGTEGAWLERQLDIAIKARTTLTVRVAMPDGRELEYLLEPTGVGGGRLRGRDRGSDIERTLPLASIRGIRAAP